MAQKNLEKLFDKNMDRKQFLAHIGAGFLVIVGISGLLKSLLEYGHKPRARVASGYGSTTYGGIKK